MKVLFRALAISLVVVIMVIVDCHSVFAGEDSHRQNWLSLKEQTQAPLFSDHLQEKLSGRTRLDTMDSAINNLKLPTRFDSLTEWKSTVLQTGAKFAPDKQSHVAAHKITPTNGGSYSWFGVLLLILLVKFTREPN